MPFAYVGAAAAATSAASSIDNMVSGPAGGAGGTYGGQPGIYIPQYQTQADQLGYQNLTNYNNFAQSFPGQYSQDYASLYNNAVSNPYASGAQNSANAAGSYSGNTLAPMAASGAQSLYASGQNALPYGAQALATAFDPQNALYNRTQQQVTDQTQAALASAGLGSSPYGAGVAGQTASNFNIDWQNAQLQRQAQGAQTYGTISHAAGADFTGAAGLGQISTAATNQAGQLPYAAYGQNQQNIQQALGATTGGIAGLYTPMQNAFNQEQAYAAGGQQASQLALSGQGQAFAQNQQSMTALGQGLGGLASNIQSIYNNWNSGGSGGSGGSGAGLSAGGAANLGYAGYVAPNYSSGLPTIDTSVGQGL